MADDVLLLLLLLLLLSLVSHVKMVLVLTFRKVNLRFYKYLIFSNWIWPRPAAHFSKKCKATGDSKSEILLNLVPIRPPVCAEFRVH